MIFELVNGRAFPSVHALLIEPFKTIWNNDLEEGKPTALDYFTYIELVCSPKKSNPFFGYSEEIRPEKVKLEVFKDKNYTLPDEIVRGVIKFKELLANSAPSYEMLISSLNAADKLKNYLNTFDLAERTHSGTAVIKPGDITKALKEIPDAAKGIEALRKKVHSELEEDAKTRNQREIGQYER